VPFAGPAGSGLAEMLEQKTEKEMTDWAEGIETRNFGIKNELDVRMLSELMRGIFALVLVAGAFLFYAWVRSQIVSTGYEGQQLFLEEQALLRTQKSLILEEETLRNPERIDALARNELKMMPLRPNQLILPQTEDLEHGASNAVAMVNSETATVQRASEIAALVNDRHN
jgi:cell division protein FtsL